jgi:hypothetical protein
MKLTMIHGLELRRCVAGIRATAARLDGDNARAQREELEGLRCQILILRLAGAIRKDQARKFWELRARSASALGVDRPRLRLARGGRE